MRNIKENNGHPAITGQKIQNSDGTVEYRLILQRKEVGVFMTDIGIVGITRVDLESAEPRVRVDCTRNMELQGDVHYVDKRDVFIGPGAQIGYDKISPQKFLSVDVGGITNGHTEIIFVTDSHDYGRI